MKKLSDYEGNEAIELWADLIIPLTQILGDNDVKEKIQSGAPKLIIAREVLKKHSEEAKEIMLRVDSTPINGLNIILRLVSLLADIGQNEEIKSFFGYAAQEQTENGSFGSAMGNTEGEEN